MMRGAMRPMNEQQLAERFEGDRAHLHAVAYRLLGSASEADDAVQEAWLRTQRSDLREVENLSGWLTTVVGRICLDMLRSRKARGEEPLEPASKVVHDSADPERAAVQAEAVGLAMLAVLQRLAPAERIAFVLHDVFDVSFEEIAVIVERSPAAARQLASRGRRRVQGATEDGQPVDTAQHREIVEAFLKASRTGDLDALLTVLDPEVTLRADETALRMGVRSGWLSSQLHGAEAVAEQFNDRAQAAQLALIDGIPGVVWAPGGTPRVLFAFTILNGSVMEIQLAANPERLSRANVKLLR